MERIDFNRVVETIQDEIRSVFGTLKDKGANRFGRALALSLALPFAAYLLIYTPAMRKLAHLDDELSRARLMARQADDYNQVKNRLLVAYSKLPLPKDRANWLSDTVKEALRSENIVASQLPAPSEEDVHGIVTQNLSIGMNLKFSELMALLTRLEASKPLIHISRVELTKNSTPLGNNTVNCVFSTVIFTERY